MQNSNKFLEKLIKLLKLYGVKLIVSILVSTALFLSIYISRQMTVMAALDGCFYASIVMFVAAIMSIVTNQGFFDIFAYNGLKIKYYFNPKAKREQNEFFGTYEYTKSKEEKRKNYRFCYVVYLIVGGIYLIPTISLYIVYLLI